MTVRARFAIAYRAIRAVNPHRSLEDKVAIAAALALNQRPPGSMHHYDPNSASRHRRLAMFYLREASVGGNYVMSKEECLEVARKEWRMAKSPPYVIIRPKKVGEEHA